MFEVPTTLNTVVCGFTSFTLYTLYELAPGTGLQLSFIQISVAEHWSPDVVSVKLYTGGTSLMVILEILLVTVVPAVFVHVTESLYVP